MNNHPHNCKIATMVSVMKRRNMEIKGYNLVRKVRNISWRKMTFKLTSTIN
jgi:mRNA-degrading endonuclease toxin of MazEF toxin-antitoxin module